VRTFKLVRSEDLSGVSGVGEVAEGVEFKDGTVVISWLTKFHSIGIYENVEELVAIHGHEGRTHVEFMKEV
jgi:hypothetical protein